MLKIMTISLLGSGCFASTPLVKIDGKGVCQIEEAEYPVVGFGTYPLADKACTSAVEQAFKAGYRIIDTATYYENFEPIAKAVNCLGREQFYLVSKVWYDQQAPTDLRKDLDFTLKQLQTDYLDAYLLHWPNSHIPIEETLQAMNELRLEGKIRHIGLSNVTVNHLKRVLDLGIPITWVQIEMSPLFYDPAVLKFCQENSIAVQAWSPIGRGGLGKDPLLAKIGKKYGKTPSQIALRWIIQHGCIPLPSSGNPRHIQENIDVFGFTLSKNEMDQIDQNAKGGQRLRVTVDSIGFSDEFDFSYEECWPQN